MINHKELPIFLLMAFTLVYATIGNPNNEIWSGLYFIANYLTLFFLFNSQKSKIIRIFGIALSISILIFIMLKFFIKIECERYYTMIPFTICLIAIIKLENRKNTLK
jgi:hypothetical protein